MYYVLLSSTGNMIDSYDDEPPARAALRRIIDAEPEAAENVAMVTYGDDGQPISDPVFAKAPAGIGNA
jgi:hypothetical protein